MGRSGIEDPVGLVSFDRIFGLAIAPFYLFSDRFPFGPHFAADSTNSIFSSGTVFLVLTHVPSAGRDEGREFIERVAEEFGARGFARTCSASA